MGVKIAPTKGSIKLGILRTEGRAKVAIQNGDAVVQKGHGSLEHQIENAPHWYGPQIIVRVIDVAGPTHQSKRHEDPAKVDVLLYTGLQSQGIKTRGASLDR